MQGWNNNMFIATEDDLCMVLNTGAKLTGIRYDTLIDTVCTLSILNAN